MRRIASLTAVALLVALLAAFGARADEIEVRDARLRATEEGLVLDADFAFDLTPRLLDVVGNGVPLYFRVDFELTRHRWYSSDQLVPARRIRRLRELDLPLPAVRAVLAAPVSTPAAV